ncbi:MAG: polyprenyl synthetase family protein [Acidobacteria bacterium]|nr:polyprenyl synthetase family protein [Acidobacteriota bacterium]
MNLEPAALTDPADRTTTRLRSFLDAELTRWTTVNAAFEVPLRALEDMVVLGGKRLRPAFCHWAHVAAGGDPDRDVVLNMGAALEILHVFALAHDDIMDGSERRRGLPTVHAQFSDIHRSHDWRGESRRFGEGVAILIGDLCHAYADVLAVDISGTARTLWNELRVELNVGQYLDISGTAERSVSADTARQIVSYKSGRYTIERPMQIGSALAGNARLVGEVLAYGEPLGAAFQLRDDVLGAFGDTEETGKPVGDDLREGKPTLLLAGAWTDADEGQRKVLDRVGESPNDDEVSAIQAVMVETGALSSVESDIERLTTEAITALNGLDIVEDARQPLVDLAHFVSERRH